MDRRGEVDAYCIDSYSASYMGERLSNDRGSTVENMRCGFHIVLLLEIFYFGVGSFHLLLILSTS